MFPVIVESALTFSSVDSGSVVWSVVPSKFFFSPLIKVCVTPLAETECMGIDHLDLMYRIIYSKCIT
jgi:hypothetical protein